MGNDMWEISWLENVKERELSTGQTERVMKASSPITKCTAKVNISGLTDAVTTVNTSEAKCKASANITGRVEVAMKEPSSMIRCMGRENIGIQMVAPM